MPWPGERSAALSEGGEPKRRMPRRCGPCQSGRAKTRTGCPTLGPLRGAADGAPGAHPAGVGLAGLAVPGRAALPADAVLLELHVLAQRVGADPVSRFEDLLVAAHNGLRCATEPALCVLLKLYVLAGRVGARPVPRPDRTQVGGRRSAGRRHVGAWCRRGVDECRGRGRRHVHARCRPQRLGRRALAAGHVALELHVSARRVGAYPVPALGHLVVAADDGLWRAALAAGHVPSKLMVTAVRAQPVFGRHGVRQGSAGEGHGAATAARGGLGRAGVGHLRWGGGQGLGRRAPPAGHIPLELHIPARRVRADPVPWLNGLRGVAAAPARGRLRGAALPAGHVLGELVVPAARAEPVLGREDGAGAGASRLRLERRRGEGRGEGWGEGRGGPEGLASFSDQAWGGARRLGRPALPARRVSLELEVLAGGVWADPVPGLGGLVVAAHHRLGRPALPAHKVPLELVVPAFVAVPVPLPEAAVAHRGPRPAFARGARHARA
mmetsp:Transcript_58468/g.187800  ORF Transcript_58468/g.187800 Transcript_58468/m.187800 type:complete len:496 (-) Transcript_58468:12-1499(-)